MRTRSSIPATARFGGRGGTRPSPASLRNTPGAPDPIAELHALRELHHRLDSLVSGSRLLDEVLLIVEPLASAPEPTYTLTDASTYTGFSAAHLGKLVRAGRIPNHGRKGNPRVKLSECPTRPKPPAKLALVVEEGP